MAAAGVAALLMTASAAPAIGAGGDDPPPVLVFDAHPRARTYGHLFALDPRTGRRVRITFGRTDEQRGLARWSPNGEKFLYRSESPHAGSFDLSVMDADGSNRMLLFSGGSYIYGAAWSPDSSGVVLTTEPQTDQGSFVFVDTATGRQRTLRLGLRERGATSVSWSKQDVIAFAAVNTGNGQDSVGELYTVKPDGTDLRVLARPQYPEQGLDEPRWSPDGHRIVFTREQPHGNGEVDVVDPEGKLLQRVPTHAGARSVTWAPDGRHLIFIAGADDLHTVALNGSGERLIARGVYDPDWRPGTRYQLPNTGG